jgi:hypothetical protein
VVVDGRHDAGARMKWIGPAQGGVGDSGRRLPRR